MIRAVNLALLAAILLLFAVWIAFWQYSSRLTMPSGMKLGGWSVGGLTLEQLEEGLRERTSALNEQKVRLDHPSKLRQEVYSTLGVLGLRTNEEELLQEAALLFQGSRLERVKRRWGAIKSELTIQMDFSDEQLRQTMGQLWPELMKPVVRNAERRITADDRVEYVPEVVSETVDIDLLAGKLAELAEQSLSRFEQQNPERSSPVHLALPIQQVLPDVTVAQLKEQRIERVIASFSTIYPENPPGRAHNIRVTADTIHDLLLKPGETFDYGRIVREAEQKHGYREAPVIYNGKLVPGIGGGICQVSSTLYNAVLLAGLKIDERRNHSLPVSYVPLGQDATFANGYINFTFTNNSGSHMLIRTESSGNQLTVKLFGHMPETVMYTVESKLIETLQPPVKQVHNPTLRQGEQAVVQQGAPGYIVETYRTRHENGTPVLTERVSRDTYNAQPTIIAINLGASAPDPKDRPPGSSQRILEDGVSGPVFPKGR